MSIGVEVGAPSSFSRAHSLMQPSRRIDLQRRRLRAAVRAAQDVVPLLELAANLDKER